MRDTAKQRAESLVGVLGATGALFHAQKELETTYNPDNRVFWMAVRDHINQNYNKFAVYDYKSFRHIFETERPVAIHDENDKELYTGIMHLTEESTGNHMIYANGRDTGANIHHKYEFLEYFQSYFIRIEEPIYLIIRDI